MSGLILVDPHRVSFRHRRSVLTGQDKLEGVIIFPFSSRQNLLYLKQRIRIFNQRCGGICIPEHRLFFCSVIEDCRLQLVCSCLQGYLNRYIYRSGILCDSADLCVIFSDRILISSDFVIGDRTEECLNRIVSACTSANHSGFSALSRHRCVILCGQGKGEFISFLPFPSGQSLGYTECCITLQCGRNGLQFVLENHISELTAHGHPVSVCILFQIRNRGFHDHGLCFLSGKLFADYHLCPVNLAAVLHAGYLIGIGGHSFFHLIKIRISDIVLIKRDLTEYDISIFQIRCRNNAVSIFIFRHGDLRLINCCPIRLLSGDSRYLKGKLSGLQLCRAGGIAVLFLCFQVDRFFHRIKYIVEFRNSVCFIYQTVISGLYQCNRLRCTIQMPFPVVGNRNGHTEHSR